jgi:hypothetical protein
MTPQKQVKDMIYRLNKIDMYTHVTFGDVFRTVLEKQIMQKLEQTNMLRRTAINSLYRI